MSRRTACLLNETGEAKNLSEEAGVGNGLGAGRGQDEAAAEYTRVPDWLVGSRFGAGEAHVQNGTCCHCSADHRSDPVVCRLPADGVDVEREATVDETVLDEAKATWVGVLALLQ